MLMEPKNNLIVDTCKELDLYPSLIIDNGPMQEKDADAMWLWLCAKEKLHGKSW